MLSIIGDVGNVIGGLPESVACTPNVEVLPIAACRAMKEPDFAIMGVPEITPVLWFSVRLAGNFPETTAQVNGDVPPDKFKTVGSDTL